MSKNFVTLSDNFVSPKSQTLSGINRKVKDICIDLNNLTDDWICCNKNGLTVITKLANMKMITNENIVKECSDKCYAEINSCCLSLRTIFEKMRTILTKLQKVKQDLAGLVELERHDKNAEDLPALFSCYTCQDFYEAAAILVGMYELEIKVKQSIVESIGLASTRRDLVLCSSAWQHEPYIHESQQKYMLSHLLQEVGIVS